MNDQQKTSILDTELQSEESKRLVNNLADLETKQLDFLDTSGKNIIERIATFLTVLFGVTAIGTGFPPPYLRANLAAKLLVIITLIIYLASLGAGLWAIQPRSYKLYQANVSGMREELDKILKHKMRWVRWAGILFALGTVALAALIVSIIWRV